jgi:hypothetical protein
VEPVVHEGAPSRHGVAAASAQQDLVPATEIGTSRETDTSAANSAPRLQDLAGAPASKPGDGLDVRFVRIDPQAAPGAAPTVNESDALSAEHNTVGNASDSLAFADAALDHKAFGPRAADLIGRSPALPLETLQTGIQDFLRELDHLGTAMITPTGGLSLTCWLLSALAAAVSCEIARRQMRRKQLDLAANACDEPLFAWFPEGTELPNESEA